MKTLNEVNELVIKAIKLQSIEEILNVSQVNYRERLTEYFFRVETTVFNSDVLHDINGLKYKDEF